MSSTPEQVQQKIDAEADRLRELLVRFVLEMALSHPPFKNVVADMEEVIKVARQGSGREMEATRDSLRALQASLTDGTAREAQEIKELITASNKRSGQALAELGKRLTLLERQVQPGVPNGAPMRRAGLSLREVMIAGVALIVGALGMMAAGPMWAPSPPAVAIQPAACAVPGPDGSCRDAASAAANHSMAIATAQSSSSSAPPAPPPVWDTLWASALSQPAVCGGPKDKPVAFAKCICPESTLLAGDAPSPEAVRSCAWDAEKARKWTDRQAVGALQAVLRVTKLLNDPVDGGVGSNTNLALDKLASQCTAIGPDVVAAQKALGEKDDKGISEARRKERAQARSVAAAKLLGILQGNAACLTQKSADATDGQAHGG